jgi:hypothetical protein
MPMAEQVYNKAQELISPIPHIADVEHVEFKIEGKCCLSCSKLFSVKDSYSSTSLPQAMKVRELIYDICNSKYYRGC